MAEKKLELKKFETNIFYYYASEYMERATSDTEIRSIDMTAEFWREVEAEIINDELVDININAKVRGGKSTLGIWLGREVYNLLLKHKKRKDATPFGMQNIARDQQEYSRIMRDPKIMQTVIVTDEVNELEHTGENVTVERALNNVFSNVQAGRYVHRISCSPKDVADPNADIFLEVVSVDRTEKITHCYLYYKMFRGGNEYMQLLGYVNFPVGDLIEVWDNHVKKHFLKPVKSDYDKRLIRKYQKEDFYTEYIIKKYEKMELITKEGIMKPRILEYASVILDVEAELMPLTKINVLNRGTIKNFIKMYCRKMRIPTSIVGEELMTQEVEGILNLWKTYFKLARDVGKLQDKKGKDDDITLDFQVESLQKIQDKLMDTITAQKEELKRYKEINDRYNEHIE